MCGVCMLVWLTPTGHKADDHLDGRRKGGREGGKGSVSNVSSSSSSRSAACAGSCACLAHTHPQQSRRSPRLKDKKGGGGERDW